MGKFGAHVFRFEARSLYNTFSNKQHLSGSIEFRYAVALLIYSTMLSFVVLMLEKQMNH